MEGKQQKRQRIMRRRDDWQEGKLGRENDCEEEKTEYEMVKGRDKVEWEGIGLSKRRRDGEEIEGEGKKEQKTKDKENDERDGEEEGN